MTKYILKKDDTERLRDFVDSKILPSWIIFDNNSDITSFKYFTIKTLQGEGYMELYFGKNNAIVNLDGGGIEQIENSAKTKLEEQLGFKLK